MQRAVLTEAGLGNGGAGRRSSATRELLKSPLLQRALTFIFVYVFLLTLIGIVYTNELSWSWRTAYLLASAFLCLPICFSYGFLTIHFFDLRARAAGAVSLAASALLSAGSATVLVYGVDRLFRVGFMPNKMRDPYVLALAALLVCVSVAQYAMLRRGKGQEAVPRVEKLAGEKGPAGRMGGVARALGTPFFRRLPAALGHDIVYLKMRDHYVEVFTTKGRTTVLMRFGDAVAELEGLGLRVHRSYWVAYAHAERLPQRGPRSYLRITGGHQIPVSRPYLQAVIEAREFSGKAP